MGYGRPGQAASAPNRLWVADLTYVWTRAGIERQEPWRTVEQVELGTAKWVDCWNTRRLHSACRDVPPAEHEAVYHQRLQATDAAA